MLADPTDCRFVSTDECGSFEGVLIDVRTPEAYDEAHIPESENFCVHQVDFLEQVHEVYPDRSTKLLVYGDGPPYKADL